MSGVLRGGDDPVDMTRLVQHGDREDRRDPERRLEVDLGVGDLDNELVQLADTLIALEAEHPPLCPVDDERHARPPRPELAGLP